MIKKAIEPSDDTSACNLLLTSLVEIEMCFTENTCTSIVNLAKLQNGEIELNCFSLRHYIKTSIGESDMVKN